MSFYCLKISLAAPVFSICHFFSSIIGINKQFICRTDEFIDFWFRLNVPVIAPHLFFLYRRVDIIFRLFISFSLIVWPFNVSNIHLNRCLFFNIRILSKYIKLIQETKYKTHSEIKKIHHSIACWFTGVWSRFKI